MHLEAPIAFSAKVRLNLVAAGKTIPLSQVAPNFCISREPVDLPPQTAEINIDVDDVTFTHRVLLPEGMSIGREKTSIERINS